MKLNLNQPSLCTRNPTGIDRAAALRMRDLDETVPKGNDFIEIVTGGTCPLGHTAVGWPKSPKDPN